MCTLGPIEKSRGAELTNATLAFNVWMGENNEHIVAAIRIRAEAYVNQRTTQTQYICIPLLIVVSLSQASLFWKLPEYNVLLIVCFMFGVVMLLGATDFICSVYACQLQ